VPRPLNLVDVAIDNNHLAVKVGKRTETKVSVFQNGLNAYLAIIDSGNKRARGRDLENGVDGFRKVLGEGGGSHR
jgi:hypothetical protein